MKAAILDSPGAVEQNPLKIREVDAPEPGRRQVLVRVTACGICRTDLHVTEGELTPRRTPIIPGHQVVGRICKAGPDVDPRLIGTRVGIAWLHHTCGVCAYCRSGRENLCDRPEFTGYTVHGGFAEYALAEADFIYGIPEGFEDLQAAPLLCAGIIGFRCLRTAAIEKGARLGIYGFGAAGHVCIQVARYWGIDVYVCTRERRHQLLAEKLGAAWTGNAADAPPVPLDASIIFAPAGELVPAALTALKKGGRLVLGGIYMSPIPSFAYDLIYRERSICSVANNTRQDGRDFLEIAAAIPIRTKIETFTMDEANRALQALKHDGIRGAGVLAVG
ncbi:MAG: zinc-dependent alcohol dehydrogenase family protein [Acidobacteria bacterium]|nr:zinc-dependent alcohol dehydrogenase family protein [Acidobacteriota bacterium]